MLRAIAVVIGLCRIAGARALTPEDLARKIDGSHVEAVPLAAYSIDFA